MSELTNPTLVNYSKYLLRELRSDHAGETGAVYIYKGIIAVAKYYKDEELIRFAIHHGATETEHLNLIENVLDQNERSRLLIPWRVAGWLTGALPALMGRKAVYATIAAVETFVERHYQHQIDHLKNTGDHQALLEILIRCQADEIDHKNEALAKASKTLPLLIKYWYVLVGSRSAAAVILARLI